jgi:hypothetical protein
MVLLTYVLAWQVTKRATVALTAAGLLALSPWSLQLSRAAFEAHLAACFNLVAFICFLEFPKKKWLLPVSIIFFVLAFYTFNANRILSPLFIGLLSLIFWRELIKQKLIVALSIILGIILILPSVSYLQTRESRLRFQEVSIFTSLNIVKMANERIERNGNTWWAKIIHNRRVYFAKEFLAHYADNFKGEFLFIKGDGNPRLSIQDSGELFLFELPLLVIGLYCLLIRKDRFTAVLFGWLLLAPIPAGMARETPHMLRIASILPTFQIIEGIGFLALWHWLQTKPVLVKNAGIFLGILVATACVAYYQHNYWVHYPRDWSGEWQYGYKQMVAAVEQLESNYDHILVTDNLGRPYIYFLLYNKVNPQEYVRTCNAQRDWYGLWNVYGFGKYDFASQIPPVQGRTLKVGTAGAFSSSGKKLAEITDPSGKVVFEIGEP